MAEQLTITFSGICTHFWGVIPGVPMRTVLPNAAAANLRAVAMMPADEPAVAMSYNTMPHVALLVITDNQVPPNIIGEPLVLAGARLEVVNTDFSANPQVPTRPDGGFSLTSYVENFAFSDDVVLNGRAACYFDTFAATNVTVNGTGQQARSTTVTMDTTGTPLLLVTPFPGSLMQMQRKPPNPPGQSWVIPINSPSQLWVMNVDFNSSPAAANVACDFLLNYLVALGGIPNQVISPTPGMQSSQWEPLQEPTPLFIGQQFLRAGPQLDAFGTFAQQFPSTTEMLTAIALSEVTAITSIRNNQDPVGSNEACSDSHYP